MCVNSPSTWYELTGVETRREVDSRGNGVDVVVDVGSCVGDAVQARH